MKRPYRILVVDDEPGMRRAIVTVLSKAKEFDVHTANDGAEALAAALANRPDVVVSDLTMPGMDGFELCRQIHRSPELRDVMVLMLTAHADSARKVEGLSLGVDDYVTKPFEPDELLARVRGLVRLKTASDALRGSLDEVAVLHAALERSFDGVLALLRRMIDMARPGAAERGDRLERFGTRVAERIGLARTDRDAMVVAAHLLELGAVLPVGTPPEEGDAPVMIGGQPWRSIVSSAAVVATIERLEPAADLLRALGEHWDGTGFPRRLERGEIEAGARILRPLADLLHLTDADPSLTPARAVETIARYAHTRYDPLVVAEIESQLRGASQVDLSIGGLRVAIEGLAPGMILSEDLVTVSGVMLLRAGAEVTPAMCSLIARRHAIDPVIYGAMVRDDAAR